MKQASIFKLSTKGGRGGAGGDGRKTTVAASHSFLQQYKAYNINLGKCINNSYS